MITRSLPLGICVLFCLPTIASAGPISFTFGTGNVTASDAASAPQLGITLVPAPSSNPMYTAEQDATTPVTLDVVTYEPQRLPTPNPRDVHPDGTTHWNNDGYFAVDVSLTDTASGENATFQLHGRAHIYSSYSSDSGWAGYTVFWFDDRQTFTLGENTYTVWGANQYTTGAAAVNVWVGSGAPVYTPEPGTLALAVLGLVPLGLRRFRRA